MAWVKIDDLMPQHPKLVGAGPEAFALDVAALCYSNRLRTDGFIPEGMLNAILPGLKAAKRHATALEAAGRWIRDDKRNGWWIHDYEEYQPSAEQAEDRSKKNERAGSKGNHVKWHEQRDIVADDCKWCRKPIANDSQNAREGRSQGDSHSDRPVPVPDPVPQRDTSEPGDERVSVVEVVPAEQSSTWPDNGWVWQAFAELFQEPTTESKRKHRWQQVNEVTSSLSATWNIDRAEVGRRSEAHDEVLTRAQRWPLHFDQATLTERALADHWDTLGRAPLRANRSAVRQLDDSQKRARRRAALEGGNP